MHTPLLPCVYASIAYSAILGTFVFTIWTKTKTILSYEKSYLNDPMVRIAGGDGEALQHSD